MALTGNSYRKFVSDFVLEDHSSNTARPSFATVTLVGTGEVVDPIGLPVVWNNVSAWVFYKQASDLALITTESNLPDGSIVGVVVGSVNGFGHNNENVTVASGAGTKVTIMYRDGVIVDNIDFSLRQVTGAVDAAPALAAKQAAFKKQLEKQGIVVKNVVTSVTPSYTA